MFSMNSLSSRLLRPQLLTTLASFHSANKEATIQPGFTDPFVVKMLRVNMLLDKTTKNINFGPTPTRLSWILMTAELNQLKSFVGDTHYDKFQVKLVCRT